MKRFFAFVLLLALAVIFIPWLHPAMAEIPVGKGSGPGGLGPTDTSMIDGTVIPKSGPTQTDTNTVTGATYAPAITDTNSNHDYNVEVFVNSNKVNFPDQAAFVDNTVGRTYVPIRFVSEALGATVSWLESKQMVSIFRNGTIVTLTIGSDTATVDKGTPAPVKLDAPAFLMNDRTLVPLRFVSEGLGADVSWTPPTGGGKGRVDITDRKDVTKPTTTPTGGTRIVLPAGGGGTDTTPATDSGYVPWSQVEAHR